MSKVEPSRKRTKTGGRKAGTPNIATADIKDMIKTALSGAGGVEYLQGVAASHPAAFCTLLGRIIPADVRATVNVKGGLVLIPAKSCD